MSLFNWKKEKYEEAREEYESQRRREEEDARWEQIKKDAEADLMKAYFSYLPGSPTPSSSRYTPTHTPLSGFGITGVGFKLKGGEVTLGSLYKSLGMEPYAAIAILGHFAHTLGIKTEAQAQELIKELKNV